MEESLDANKKVKKKQTQAHKTVKEMASIYEHFSLSHIEATDQCF